MQLNYTFPSSENQVVITVRNSTMTFVLSAIWELLAFMSALQADYAFITLNCITWIRVHPKSHNGDANEPKRWAIALKTSWKKSTERWVYKKKKKPFQSPLQIHHQKLFLATNTNAKSHSYNWQDKSKKAWCCSVYIQRQEDSKAIWPA